MADEQEPVEAKTSEPVEEKKDEEGQEEEVPPLTDEAEAHVAKFDRRQEQGLGQFPFPDGEEPFEKIGDPRAAYTVKDIVEVCRIVSSWYVKKANYYHDVTNLQIKYQPHDVKQVIVHRMREVFPKWKPSEQAWRDFFKLLLLHSDSFVILVVPTLEAVHVVIIDSKVISASVSSNANTLRTFVFPK